MIIVVVAVVILAVLLAEPFARRLHYAWDIFVLKCIVVEKFP